MAAGLYSGASGLALGTGLYKGVSGLWGGASGLINGFGGGEFSPASLFAAGEQGAWYDPSDLTSMRQLSTGATAVTAPGDSVGFIADKRLMGGQTFDAFVAAQPELVTNGDFSAGATGWTQTSPTFSVSGDQATLTSNNARANNAAFSTVVGQYYLVSWQIISQSGSTFINARRADTNASLASLINTSAGTRSFVFVAATTTSYISIDNGGSADPVCVIDNISVKAIPDNHATQSNAAQRPTYGVVPATGRRNLFTATNDLTNLTNWPTGNIGGMIRVGAGIRVDGADNFGYISGPSDNISITSGQSYVASFTVVSDQTISNVPLRVSNRTGAAFSAASTLLNMTAGVPQRISLVVTASATGATRPEFGVDTRAAIVPGGSNATGYTVTFSDPQFETGSTATAYQRVVSAFDVTEAGVASRSYLSFDGTDDGMLTGNIVPGTDKAQVFAGVRKLSDAAIGAVVETSANSGGNSGAIAVTAPAGAASASYLFQSRGTAISQAIFTNAAVAAPVTSALTAIGDIAADTAILRVDGTQVASSATDQGTGNYLTYPLYIGRRGGASTPFNGQIFGLIVRFGANLSAATVTQTETWLANRVAPTVVIP